MKKDQTSIRHQFLKLIFICISIFACVQFSKIARAQSPAAIPYQAVARDSAGNLMATQTISLRLSIHNLIATGTVVYSETKSTITNSLGLFTTNIGEGTPITGTLAGVNWSNGAKFIQVEMDASGGTNYVDMGTTQLMSVPYALFAAKAGNLPNGTVNGNTMRWNGTAWVADNNIYNSGGNVGIGTTTPATKLDVAGTTKTTNLQMTNNGGFGKVMISDANGNASWSPSTSLSITELDPQVNSVISNQIPKWNGTTLNDGIITDNGTNIGIGTTTPTTKLDVAGTTKTTNLQLPTGAGAGKVLQSDATGNASWVNSTSLPITELDPQVGTLSNNKVPKWNGSTLTDGVMYDNGTNVGIGTPTPTLPLTVRSLVVDTFENVASLANANVDPAFQLNTTRGDVTNTSGSVMTQIGQAYNGNPPTEAVRFHRGSTSTNGAISITTANTERMRIMNNGNIGIGTTAPRGVFDVQKHGDIYLSDSTNSGSDQVGFLPGNVVLAPYNGTNLSYLTARRENTTGSNELQLRTVNNGTTINAMRIDSAGNIGIGTTNPMNKLDIEGGVAIGAGYSGSNIAPTNGAIIQGNVGLGTGTQTPINKLDVEGGIAIGAGYSGTNVAPTNGAIIQGNVGIGTSDARALLDLGTTVANRKIILNASQDNSHQFTGFGVNATAPGNNLRYQIDSTGGNHTFHAATSPTTSAELMRISGTGNVGIGTTAPTQKLDVAGTTRTTAFQMPTGAANNFVLKSDATGNASWTNLSTIGLAETDPKVGTLSLNKIPKWNGTALADGVIFDNGTNIGVGTLTPTTKLDVVGTTKTTAFQLPTGAGVNKVLQSDATGNASWVNLSSITVSETDPKVGTLSTSKVPRWNGTTLANGTITDDGTEVGLGIATPTSRLHIKSEGSSTVPLTIEKSNSTNPIFTVTQGSGTGNGFVGVYDNLGIEGSRIHSTNDSWVGSNLGVGTSTPRGVFDVQKHGDIYLADSTVNGTDQVLFAPGNLRMVPWNGGNVSYLQVSRADLSGTSELQLRTSAGGNYVDAMRIDELGRVGIGTLNPANKLDVSGTIRTNDIIISTGAAAGKILTSDATGNATWELPSASETDPQVGALSTNNVPRWNGTALSTGTITDIASNVGIGTASPLNRLDVEGGMAIGSNYAGSWNVGSNNVAIEGKLSVGTPTNTNGLNIASNAAIGNGYETANAPLNGLIVKGFTGIGTSTPTNRLDVSGGLAVGSIYAGVTAAPSNGAIIEGLVGIGTSNPQASLDVNGSVRVGNFQMTGNSPGIGKFLRSYDNLGHCEWASPSALVNELDPKVASTINERIPKWNGSLLTDGDLVNYPNGKIGIGTSGEPDHQFTVIQNAASGDVATFVSGDINRSTHLGIGRNYFADGIIGVEATPGHYFANSQLGDFIFRTESSNLINSGGKRILLGTESTLKSEVTISSASGQLGVDVSRTLRVGYGNQPGGGGGFILTPIPVLDIKTGGREAWIHGNPNGISNSPTGHALLVNECQNGIAVQVANSTPDNSNNFITFFDANGTAKGAIEGQSYADLQGSWEYVWFYTHHALAAATLAASTACNALGGILPPFICQLAVDGVQLADEVADWVLYAVEMENNYGITYKSGGADYAEWMPRTNITETLVAGDVVGVKDGHISKSTTNADQLMVISTAPMVLGNTPEKNRENDYNKVAFMGQVPVKVNGMVKSGDYVLCSGYEDGYAYAKNEETMKASDYKYIVGIAWADKKTEGIGFVNTAVGVNSNKLSGRMANMQEENETLKNQILSIASYLQSKDPSFNISLPTQTKTEEVKVAKANPQQDIAQVQIGFIDIIGEIKANPDHYTKIFKSVKAEVIKRGINLDKAPEIRDMLNDADSYIKGLEKYQRLLKEKTEAMNAQPDHK